VNKGGRKVKQCPRLYNEQRVPGNRHSPDGPAYTVRYQCGGVAEHPGPHQYAVAVGQVLRG
jgi:hypothetical protein